MRKNDTEKKRFKLFDLNKDGKGVYEIEDRKPTLGFFFKLLFRKFSQLLRLNLLMLLQFLPILVIVGFYLSGEKTPVATDVLYAPLYGINSISSSPSFTTLLDTSLIQMDLPVFSPLVNIIMIVMAVIFVLTFGWHNTASAYVTRGLFRGDAVFVFSDYFYGMKKNLKQGFFLGMLDAILCLVLVADFIYFYQRTGSFGLDFMYFTIFAISIVYFIMRFYMYNILVTFDTKNFKILKNCLIFTILGIKRNIMAILGLFLLAVLHVFLIILFLPMGISIPLVLPLVYIFALCNFITTYAAFPVIDKYMIQPYLDTQAIDEQAVEEE